MNEKGGAPKISSRLFNYLGERENKQKINKEE